MSKLLKFTFAVLVLALPTLGWAQQGKIAVVDLQEGILKTDVAQKRLAELRAQDDFKADKAEFERLKKQMDHMVKKFQKDAAGMSQEQQAAARIVAWRRDIAGKEVLAQEQVLPPVTVEVGNAGKFRCEDQLAFEVVSPTVIRAAEIFYQRQ